MGKKGILFSKLKAEYNLDSRQVQSYWAKAEKYGCSFDRYMAYLKKCECKGDICYDDNIIKITIPRPNDDEIKTILQAPNLLDGLIKVSAIRKEAEEKRIEAELARDRKLEAIKSDLLRVCKKHGAKLLDKKEMKNLVDAPYAEDVYIEFPFGIQI